MPEWEGSIAVNTAYAIIHKQELPFRSYTTVIINHYYALKGFRHKLHPLVFPQWAIISRAICYSQNPKKLHSHDNRLESQENFPQLITWNLFQLSPSHMWLLMLLSFPILLRECCNFHYKTTSSAVLEYHNDIPSPKNCASRYEVTLYAQRYEWLLIITNY